MFRRNVDNMLTPKKLFKLGGGSYGMTLYVMSEKQSHDDL